MDLHMGHTTADHQLAAAEVSAEGQYEQQCSQQQQSVPAAGVPAEQQQQQQQLTPTVQSGLEALASRKQDIHAKIDELGQVVLNHLEQTRAGFLQWMENYKKMVDDFGESVVQNNTTLAAETIAAQMRLGRAQQLVSSLGLEVMNPPEGPDDMVGA